MMLILSKTILTASVFIISAEGFSEKVYQDSIGVPTIGYGKNLSLSKEDLEYYKYTPISKKQAYRHLVQVLQQNENILNRYYWYNNLSRIRKAVVLDLSYNLGMSGLFSFKRFIRSLEEGKFHFAGKMLAESNYYKQVNNRAKRNIEYIIYDGCKNYCDKRHSIAYLQQEVGKLKVRKEKDGSWKVFGLQ